MARSIEQAVVPRPEVKPRGSWQDIVIPIALALVVLGVALVVVLVVPSLAADPMAGT